MIAAVELDRIIAAATVDGHSACAVFDRIIAVGTADCNVVIGIRDVMRIIQSAADNFECRIRGVLQQHRAAFEGDDHIIAVDQGSVPGIVGDLDRIETAVIEQSIIAVAVGILDCRSALQFNGVVTLAAPYRSPDALIPINFGRGNNAMNIIIARAPYEQIIDIASDE